MGEFSSIEEVLEIGFVLALFWVRFCRCEAVKIDISPF